MIDNGKKILLILLFADCLIDFLHIVNLFLCYLSVSSFWQTNIIPLLPSHLFPIVTYLSSAIAPLALHIVAYCVFNLLSLPFLIPRYSDELVILCSSNLDYGDSCSTSC